MRKTIAALILVMMVLVSCNPGPHVHSFSSDWSYDTYYHWHAATCGHSSLVEGKEDHDWEEDESKHRPKSATECEMEYWYCTICGFVDPYVDHDLEEDVEKRIEPTCSKEGEEFYTCKHCGETLSFPIDKGDHNYVKNEEESTSGSCTTGATEVFYCSVCNDKKVVEHPFEHSFDENDKCTSCGAYKAGDDVVALLDEASKTLTFKGKGAMYDADYSSEGHETTSWYMVKNKVERIVFDDGITYIGSYNFHSYPYLVRVDFGKDVKVVNGSFKSCSNLKEVNFNEGLEKVGYYAFHFCSGIEEITIPSSVKTIDTGAFNGCRSLKTITLSDGVEKIASDCFNGVRLTSVYIPKSLKYAYGLSSAQYVTEFEIASDHPTMKSDEGGALLSKDGKTLYSYPSGKKGSYSVPEGVESIEDNAFRGTSLSEIILPESLKSIGGWAMRDTSLLEKVVIKGDITYMGAYAFAYHYNDLTVDILSDEVIPYGVGSFIPGSGSKTYIRVKSDALVTAYSAAEGWKDDGNITSITVIPE